MKTILRCTVFTIITLLTVAGLDHAKSTLSNTDGVVHLLNMTMFEDILK